MLRRGKIEMTRASNWVIPCLILLSVSIGVAGWPAAALEAAIVTAVSGAIGPGRAALPLPVQAANVTRLGAATVQIGYDPALLRVTDCQRNPVFDVGLCNTALDRDRDGVADAVLFNVVSLSGISAAGSPVTLAQITWAAATTAAATAALTVTIETFTDADGIPIPVTAVDGQIVIAAAATSPPTATSSPTATPTSTTTPTLFPTSTPTTTPTAVTRKIWLPLISGGRSSRLVALRQVRSDPSVKMEIDNTQEEEITR